MTYINPYGYLERKSRSKKGHGSKPTKRNWWLVKTPSFGAGAYIPIINLSLSRKYIGKKIRVKVEIEEVKE